MGGGGESGAISTGRGPEAEAEEVDAWGAGGEGGGEDGSRRGVEVSRAPDALAQGLEGMASVNLGWKVSHARSGRAG